MKTWVKVVAVTLIVTVLGTVVAPLIWTPIGAEPTSGQLPFFIVVSLFEALALGLGISFLIFGRSMVRDARPGMKLTAWLMYLGIAWSLVSWLPHGNLHMSNGDNMQRLLYIEYGFHVTLIVTAAALAYASFSLLRRESKKANSVR